MQSGDKHICKLLRLHNIRGLELMFQHYYRPLVLWAVTYVNETAAAEDIVQDFFMAFWEKRHYEKITRDNIRGYIFASVRNDALKYIASREPLRSAIPALNLAMDVLAHDDITEEMLQMLEAEIEKLPPRTKEVLKAVYIDGMSYKETASKFSISVATVNTLLVNALRRLREFFSNLRSFFS